MNEILQKRIEEKSKELGQMFFPDNMNVFARPNWEAGYIETACKEIANFALQNQWISVEEALPEIKEHFMSEDVLCKYSDGSMGFDYLKENIFGQQWFEHECEESVVTHWMLIPQLKGGENE